MADVTTESCILNQESCIQAEAPQEKTNQAEPTEESKNEGEEREGREEREEQEKREEREGCEGREEQEEREGRSNSNIYNYIKEDLFTSEIFKVKIQNLPKYICFNDLKKFLNKHGLNPHKIKLMGKESFAFVTFKNQKDRDEAMKLVHGVQWKGKVLSVRLAKPKADPLIRKRRLDEEAADAGQPAAKRPAEGHDGAEDEPLSVQIANAVTPLWQVPYDEQLRRKEREVEEVLHTLTREIGNSNKAMLPWLFMQKEKNNGVCCPLESIRPSPVQTEYRNKCEFVIGTGADGEDKTVGFRLGKYKGGSCAVASPSDTVHVPAAAKRVVLAFQNYIRTTPYAVYSPEKYEGHWRQLTVRTSRTNQIMAIVFFHPQKLAEDEMASLKASLRRYFTDSEGKDSGVTSLHFVRMGQRTSAGTEDLPCELVAGDAWIHEELLGLRFRISPHSFFQTNTPAAEVLYSAVGEWAQLDHDSTVLDVCCGTGTIGISLAKRVRKVIGIELCQEAVDDAKVNAQANGLTNIEFHCGKAEDIFPTVLNAVVSPNVTAIVDPPRAGLNSKVILAIRWAEHLKRLVYVACNAKAAMNNFIDLCRAPSNRVRGAPFRPVRAMAVDLFPQTMHCETILLFERVDY
ncbi:tRNA (uracil-5-)-methyltransferase homolog A [Pangasianodon hypophthalmus]|uniref:tRNA (uracil-5-)-methyltransferase homolog A n=1 Tax=Pangasianodon hypophthalmus TaxID=310915 RepID=UPI002307EDF3|nr:tRNA (uracil-5-)-methyltransferase homolog A [Pangasianodon hypophthalmus]XP_053084768.1 tRNA (uracil-5-)-methyltransferase homolog A [Pangasianodon hypophthalmus]XP_053084769.1 tRNA (uracil-5-)-methyltransferase homolog A [Pangasianodon hypophthalmus]